MTAHNTNSERAGSIDKTLTILGTISQGKRFRILKAQLGTKYVILKAANTPDAMHTEILRREYELGSTLSHACIVTMIEFREHTQVGAVIVMEYIEGMTLGEFIARRPSLNARHSLLNDILDGMDYLHHRGILHNDLKPANIIVNNYGAARIIDFGLSASDDSLWNGCFGGSDNYTAPEILNGEGVWGVTSDIYSVGRLIDDIFEGGKYRKIVTRCLNTVPQQRYHNIAALRKALTRQRWLPLVVAAAITLIVIVAFISAPYINSAQEKHKQAQQHEKQEQQREEVTEVLHQYYTNVNNKYGAYPYDEFVALSRGMFQQQALEYLNSLSADERSIAEPVWAQYFQEFDKLILSYPSISEVSSPQLRDSLFAQFDIMSREYMEQ